MDRQYDVATFGETMLRLSAPGYQSLEEAVSLDVRIGGAESNVAVALSRIGLKTTWWSRLPDNPLGRRIENEIRRWGVDTSGVLWDESGETRAGLYFIDFAVPPRSTEVYYDRKCSSASYISADQIDENIIASSRLLHLTGITSALSGSCADAIARAINLAKGSNTLVSFDTNYRSRLWNPESARNALEPLLPQLDMLITPLQEAHLLFGIQGDGMEAASMLRARYSVNAVVVTCGSEGAIAVDDSGEYNAPPYNIPLIVDRIGAGDAFDAGMIAGFLQNDLQLGLDTGMAMAALKHTIPGDLLLCTNAEIESVRSGAHHSVRR